VWCFHLFYIGSFLLQGNDVLVEQIAEAAHLYPPAPSINQYHDGDITLSSGSVQAALFSPEPSVVSVDDSSSGLKRNKRTRTVSMPFNNTKVCQASIDPLIDKIEW
jgi:hypothetical protein